MGASRLVVLVVKELNGVGGDGDHAVAGRGAAHPEFVQFLFKALQLAGCLDGGHVDEHILEGLVVVEGHDGDFAQGDGVAVQGDEQGVASGSHSRIDGDEAARIADAAHPQRVDAFGWNDETSFHVADGTAVGHLADDVRVAYRLAGIGRDDIAVVRPASMVVDSLFLRKKSGRPKQQGQYDEQAFHFTTD